MRLLEWHERAARPLPWRRARSPQGWVVLVSELALQQTSASRVADRFDDLLAVVPTPEATAARPVADVLAAWQGLGYPRRAVALHRTAVEVTARHAGVVPDDLEALLALPGVGPYTARAVLAFAYDRPTAPVDVNVGRVLARAVAAAPLSRRQAQELADAQVADGRPAAGRPAAWSGALMDLGATTCTARRPSCDACPVRRACGWRGAGPRIPEDPAARTASRARRQGRWEGSDRQVRGRLLAAALTGPVADIDLARAGGCPDDVPRAQRLADALVADGLLAATPDGYDVPRSAVPTRGRV